MQDFDVLSPRSERSQQLRAALSANTGEVQARRRSSRAIRRLRELWKRCWSWFVFGLLVVWVCAFPAIFLIHSRLLLESVCSIVDHLARTSERLCVSAIERDCII